MSRSVVLVAAIAFAACSSSSSRHAAQPAPAKPAVARAPSLLDHVPSDTPFLLSSTGSSFAGARLNDMLEQMRQKVLPALASMSDDMVAAMKPEERMGYVALKTMATLTADDLARLGMDPARVEFVAYTVGLTPIGRIRLDGPFLRSLFERARKDAGYDYPAQRYGEHEYWTWTGEKGLQVVVVIHDDQLVVALTRRAEQILPHLVNDAKGRPAHPFELATISARYPQLEGEPIVFFDPARLAVLVENVDEIRALVPEVAPACARAVGGVLRTFPALAATMAETDRNTRRSRFVIGPAPAMAKTVAALVRPIPRWPGDAGEGEAIYGLGVAPLPLLEALSDYVDDSLAAIAVCDGEPPKESMRDAIRSVAPLLAPMNGSTFVIHDIPETADMPLQVEVIADVADPYAVYSWLASQLGLPPRPPALGTPTELALGFLPATIVLEARSIAATLGVHDHAALDRLRKAPAGPRMVARISMGPGMNEGNPKGTTLMDATVDGDVLVFDMIERAP